jgi:hemolysin activation/secretion protein
MLLATGNAALAQTAPPDAGQTLRELQQQPLQTPPHTKPNLTLPPDTDTQADSEQRFLVKKIRLEGNQAIASADIEPLIAPLEGRETSLGELRQTATKITALYRARGFVVARAFVPAQEIKEGVVLMSVLEGSLSTSNILNSSKVNTAVLENIVATQKLNGKSIRSAELDRELLLMADLPAIGGVDGVLKPGKEVGTSDLYISVSPGKSQEGSLTLDNYGNRYTGQTRLSGSFDLNSPFQIGDRLAVRATVTDQHLLYGHLAYDLPANGDGLRVGAALSSSRYDLGEEFAALDASGTAHTVGLFALYPMVRGLNANAWLRGAFDYRDLKDDVRATDVNVRKSIKAATLDAYGDLSDNFGGGAYSTWRIGATFGDLSIDSPDALVIDQAGPGANGSYRKFELSATRLQALASQTSLFASLDTQWAGKNLDSSEKLSLGGMNGVRAYPQGEAVGDDGWLANLELRQDLTAGLQGALFYDHGHVDHNHNAFASGSNEQTLKGYGASIALKYLEFVVKGTVAWRRGQASVSAPDHNPRFWLMAGMNF